MSNIFTIEGTDFFFDKKLGDSFTIESSPTPYQVEVTNGNIQQEFSVLTGCNKNFFLIDRTVYDLYFSKSFSNKSNFFIINAVEENKNINTVLKVIEWLEKNNFTKSETLIVVGGGITQDIGAFVAACFKRGISWSFFPTTVLSMCDSCIGGKTGINHGNVKNQLALFSAPTSVRINTAFISTLEKNDILSGTGEILKLLISGGLEAFSVFETLTNSGEVTNHNNYTPLIKAALAVKKSVIEADEFEKMHRKCLNYGHTLGHALESSTNYAVPHGLAVAAGILAINKVAYDLELMQAATVQKIRRAIAPLLKNISVQTIDPAYFRLCLQKDKKTTGNHATLVMISEIGKTFFYKQIISDEFVEYVTKTLIEEIELCHK